MKNSSGEYAGLVSLTLNVSNLCVFLNVSHALFIQCSLVVCQSSLGKWGRGQGGGKIKRNALNGSEQSVLYLLVKIHTQYQHLDIHACI